MVLLSETLAFDHLGISLIFRFQKLVDIALQMKPINVKYAPYEQKYSYKHSREPQSLGIDPSNKSVARKIFVFVSK